MSTAAQPPISALFTLRRFDSVAESGSRAAHAARWLCLLAWLPLAVPVALVRLALAVVHVVVFPFVPVAAVRWYSRIVFPLLGLVVRVAGREHEDPSARVIAMNHVTDIDNTAYHVVRPALSLTRFSHFPRWLYRPWLLMYVSAKRDEVRSEIVDNLARTKLPIVACVEGGITNGRVGLLLFHRFLFSLNQRVQPVSVRCWRPVPIAVDNLGTTFYTNILFFFLSPITVVTVRLLPSMAMTPEEAALDDRDAAATQFANRCQAVVAADLGVAPTSYHYGDKVAFRDAHLKRGAPKARAD